MSISLVAWLSSHHRDQISWAWLWNNACRQAATQTLKQFLLRRTFRPQLYMCMILQPPRIEPSTTTHQVLLSSRLALQESPRALFTGGLSPTKQLVRLRITIRLLRTTLSYTCYRCITRQGLVSPSSLSSSQVPVLSFVAAALMRPGRGRDGGKEASHSLRVFPPSTQE